MAAAPRHARCGDAGSGRAGHTVEPAGSPHDPRYACHLHHGAVAAAGRGALFVPGSRWRDREALQSDDARRNREAVSRAMSDEAEFEAHLGILREKYRDRLAVYQQNLVIERQALAASPNPAVVSRLKMLAHDLAGSAGTFGHADVSEAAGEL